MQVHLIRSSDVPTSLFNSIYDLLVRHDGPLRFHRGTTEYALPGDAQNWEKLFGCCEGYREGSGASATDYVILLTSKPNENNWFSASQLGQAFNSFVCTGGWESLITFPSQYAAAYLVVANVLRCHMFRSEEEMLANAHEPPVGCVNDMNGWKPDIVYKFRTADICSDCWERLGERDTDRNAVSQLVETLEALRKGMLFRPGVDSAHLEPDTGELPFPVAITKRRLQGCGEPLRKFLFLLDHFDSMVRTTVLLLGQVAYGDEFGQFLVDHQLSERPAQGNWVNALRDMAGRLGGDGGEWGLTGDLMDRVQGVAEIAGEERLVFLRNEYRAHGYARLRDDSYQERFLRYSPVVEGIERLLSPVLVRLKCYYVVSSGRISRRGFEVVCLPLMGSHPDFMERILTIEASGLEDIPIERRVYVVTGGKWHDLDGRITYVRCPECQHDRVLVMDGWLYLDPYAGHRVSLR